ncbi:phage-related minor tail protein [Sphingobium sp. OAS761]|uniref:tail tape measure protein n=1 Tax=Sphingobium sp. OAS761 TaxID=2817901 RepID=UPI00209FC058|nr:tail tape measure protein [Sphingobium sp. OAS761]MCP1468703.1 phage-related minor tail protein [Sphingobium sp. OAS761]
MDDEIETLVVRVRADTQGLARDVEAMRGTLEGSLGAGADRAGLRIEQGLLRAVRSGKFGFEELRRVALGVLDEIAAGALHSAIGGGGGGSGGGLLGIGTALLTSVLGLPGRATGGPVAPGRAYMVGERGPELFVPTSSGQVVPGGGAARDVRVSIAVSGRGEESEPRLLARSARQVARAVKGALER